MPKTYRTEIIGYTFEELEEGVKESVYERNVEDFSQLIEFEPVEDDFRQLLTSHYGADPETLEVYYDVSYSQGSGACCVGELDPATVFENQVGSYFTELISLVDSHKVTINSIKIVRCGPWNFYSHENTCRVDISYTCNSNEVGDWEGEDITELEEMLTNAIREELCDFHSKLRDYYEDSTSFEAYCEYMSDADVVYTEDGRIVDPIFINGADVVDGYQLKLDFGDHSDYNFT